MASCFGRSLRSTPAEGTSRRQPAEAGPSCILTADREPNPKTPNLKTPRQLKNYKLLDRVCDFPKTLNAKPGTCLKPVPGRVNSRAGGLQGSEFSSSVFVRHVPSTDFRAFRLPHQLLVMGQATDGWDVLMLVSLFWLSDCFLRARSQPPASRLTMTQKPLNSYFLVRLG